MEEYYECPACEKLTGWAFVKHKIIAHDASAQKLHFWNYRDWYQRHNGMEADFQQVEVIVFGFILGH